MAGADRFRRRRAFSLVMSNHTTASGSAVFRTTRRKRLAAYAEAALAATVYLTFMFAVMRVH